VSVAPLVSPFAASPTGAFNLSPGSKLKEMIAFQPIAVGSASQELVVQSGDPRKPSVDVKVSGTAAGGKLSTHRTLSFPKTGVGSSVQKNLVLKNIGKGMLSGSVGILTSPFSVNPGPFGPLEPSATATVTITFQPRSASPTTPQTLTIATDPPIPGVVNVQVKGTAEP